MGAKTIIRPFKLKDNMEFYQSKVGRFKTVSKPNYLIMQEQAQWSAPPQKVSAKLLRIQNFGVQKEYQSIFVNSVTL